MDQRTFEEKIQQFKQQALQLGYSPEEIAREELRQRQKFQDLLLSQTPKKERSAIREFLPAVAGTVGELVGGPVGGAALSGGAESLLQVLEKGKVYDPGRVAQETAFGAAGGIIGKVGGKIIGKAAGKIASGLVKTGEKEGFDLAARTFLSSFNLPRNTKAVMKIEPMEVAKKIMEYDLPPFTTREALQNISNQAVNTLDTLITRSLVTVRREIPLDDVLDVMRNQISKNIIDKKEGVKIARNIMNILGVGRGKTISTQNIHDALSAVRELERIGHTYWTASGAGLPGFEKVMNPVYRSYAQIYLDTADELRRVIDNFVQKYGDINAVKTPEVIQQLFSISPKLADEVMKSRSIAELRKIMSPFVRLDQMIKLSDISSEAGVSLGPAVLGRQGSRLFGAILGSSLAGPAGTAAGFFLGPAAEGVLDVMRTPLLHATAKGIKGITESAKTMQGFARGVLALVRQSAVRSVWGSVAPGEVRAAEPPSLDELRINEKRDNVKQMVLSPDPQEQVPREVFVAMMIADFASTGGKNIDRIKKLYEFMNPKPQIPASLLTRISATEAALSYLDELERITGSVATQRFGPLARLQGVWRNLMSGVGLDPSVTTFKSYKKTMAYFLARALGESGQISNKDIEGILSSLPNEYNTVEEARTIIRNIKSTVMAQSEKLYDTLLQSQVIPETSPLPLNIEEALP